MEELIVGDAPTAATMNAKRHSHSDLRNCVNMGAAGMSVAALTSLCGGSDDDPTFGFHGDRSLEPGGPRVNAPRRPAAAGGADSSARRPANHDDRGEFRPGRLQQ